MTSKPLYSAEAVLKRWADSSSGARTITLQIEEDGGPHQFKGFEGERFAVVIVGPLSADQHYVAPPPGAKAAVGSSTRKDEAGSSQPVSSPPPSTKPKQRWNDMRPSARAALLTKDPEFQRFAAEHSTGAQVPISEETADAFLKNRCAIDSKSILDLDLGKPRYYHDAFAELEMDFRAYRQARQHGAI